jgi:hypothetical protein
MDANLGGWLKTHYAFQNADAQGQALTASNRAPPQYVGHMPSYVVGGTPDPMAGQDVSGQGAGSIMAAIKKLRAMFGGGDVGAGGPESGVMGGQGAAGWGGMDAFSGGGY